MFNKYFLVISMLLISSISLAQKPNIISEKFLVKGSCEMCKERIETTVKDMGVRSANWDVETNMLSIQYDSTKLQSDSIKKQLASVGHDTELFFADNNVFQSLPACCHYSRDKGATDQEAHQHDDEMHVAESTIRGVIFEEDKKGRLTAMSNATIKNIATNKTVVTDSMGVFQLPGIFPSTIVVSYVDHVPDTIVIANAQVVQILLKASDNNNLHQVTVTSTRPGKYISSLSTLNTSHIGIKELSKAACCNLSESFETNPSVDVSYADAVTGIKQIQLLGLSGSYAQITTENIPSIRGLSGSFGLSFIPGPWIESIQLTKGGGSIVNGYESISGQINIEQVKSETSDKLYINGFAGSMGRLETTVNFAQRLNKYWTTGLLAHANTSYVKNDQNQDGFLDNPLGRQYNVMSRWKYENPNGFVIHFDLKALDDKRQGGETDFDEATDKLTSNHYGLGMHIQQQEAVAKLGYIFPGFKFKSIGLLLSAKNFENDAYYGLNKYDGHQKSFYANLIYQSIIGSSEHKFRTGMSFTMDDFNEQFALNNYTRKEEVPGAFFEYTYSPSTKFSAIAGYRLDHHNAYGFISTPRLHVKYEVAKNTSLRFGAGTGFRVANIFAEHAGLLASSRVISILNPSSNYGFGLNPEKAVNYGVSVLQKFKLNGQSGSFMLDAYRTEFSDQVLADIDASANELLFYNLTGNSFSNSVQAEVNYTAFKKFDVRLAYRWLDVVTDFSYGSLQKALSAPHRAFINLAYETDNTWKFDLTTQWVGEKRLPNSSADPSNKMLKNYSPDYFQMNGQITKVFNRKWEVYVGAENIGNYTQDDVILNAANPFAPGFDAAVMWGPLNERSFYAGFRFKLK